MIDVKFLPASYTVPRRAREDWLTMQTLFSTFTRRIIHICPQVDVNPSVYCPTSGWKVDNKFSLGITKENLCENWERFLWNIIQEQLMFSPDGLFTKRLIITSSSVCSCLIMEVDQELETIVISVNTKLVVNCHI